MRIDDIDALLATVQFSSSIRRRNIWELPNRRLPDGCSVWSKLSA